MNASPVSRSLNLTRKEVGVTVVIPTYNRSGLLDRAIDSVSSQTRPPAEIIVVDDGSNDGTSHLIRKKKQQLPVKIRYAYQDNRGPAAARNTGIRMAVSDTIAFLDSDDHWHPSKIENQWEAMNSKPQYLISHTREKWLRRGQHLNQKKIHIPRHGDIFDHCLILCAVGMSTVMMRKKLFDMVGFFDESMPCCEDYEFWLRVSARHPFLLIDQPLTIKEGGRNDQLSVQYRVGMDRFRIKALIRLIGTACLNEDQQSLAVDELKRKCSFYLSGCEKYHNYQEIQRIEAMLRGCRISLP